MPHRRTWHADGNLRSARDRERDGRSRTRLHARGREALSCPASLRPAELRARDPLRNLRRRPVRSIKDGLPLDASDPSACENATDNTVRLPDLSHHIFRAADQTDGILDVIGVNDGSLVTEHLRLKPSDTDDLALLTVIERHGKNGNIASAWTARTGLCRGALATTVAHDHHNLLVLGNDADDIRAAAAHLASLGGGQCAVMNGQVVADLPLPVAGLMGDQPAETVAAKIRALKDAAQQTGCTLADPFATLSFLALPVIPALKLTDRGLFAL